MVLYGEALLNARRSGWEEAYIDYSSLKSILSTIEDIWSHIDLNEQHDMHSGGWEEEVRGGESSPSSGTFQKPFTWFWYFNTLINHT